MAKPFFRSNIPLGSVLTVQVSGSGDADAQAFAAKGKLELPAGEVSWSNKRLRDGVSQPMDAAGVYSGRIDITFARKSTARLQMEIAKPGGTRFVYDEPITRSTGLDRTQLLLVTKKS